MGRKARARARRRVDPAAHQREGLRQLRRLNELVGAYFGQSAQCVEAVALFTRAAAELGHQVVPQAVALAAQGPDTSVALGRRAQDAWGGDVTDQFEEVVDELVDSDWQNAGHIVVIHPGTSWMFDPTLPQISQRLGVELEPLAVEVSSLRPADGYWEFGEDDLGLRYYLVDDDTSWQAGYSLAYRECVLSAGDLVEIVRSGRAGVLVVDRAECADATLGLGAEVPAEHGVCGTRPNSA